MKKTEVFVLVLLLVCTAGLASASIQQTGREVVYSYSFSGKNPNVFFFTDVVNDGESAVSLSRLSTLSIRGAEGEALDEGYLRMIPITLEPGQSGVVYAKIISSLPASSLIKSYEYSLVPTSLTWDYTALPATGMEDHSYVRLENSGSKPLWDANGYIIVRDSEGSPVYVNSTVAYRTGIPAGGMLDFPTFFTPDLAEFLTGNGLAPAKFEVGGYIY